MSDQAQQTRLTAEALQKSQEAIDVIAAGAFRVLRAWSWRRPVHEKRLNALALGAYEGLRPHPETRKPVPFSEVCTDEMRVAVAEGIRLLLKTKVIRFDGKGRMLQLGVGVTVRGSKLDALLHQVLRDLRMRVALRIQRKADEEAAAAAASLRDLARECAENPAPQSE